MNDLITGLPIFSPLTLIIRLSFSMIAGFLIGIERERHQQPAGLRTHMVLVLGACLVMILSMYLPITFKEINMIADPGRLSAQVISGIGFLGAGAIFRFGYDVKGLTTAASIWTTSGIGLAFGAGFYLLGGLATVGLIIILQGFDYIENWMIKKEDYRLLSVEIKSDMLNVKKVIEKIKENKVDIKQISVRELISEQKAELSIRCKLKEDISIRELFQSIKSLDHIISLKIE